jgi:hypothetical protein
MQRSVSWRADHADDSAWFHRESGLRPDDGGRFRVAGNSPGAQSALITAGICFSTLSPSLFNSPLSAQSKNLMIPVNSRVAV